MKGDNIDPQQEPTACDLAKWLDLHARYAVDEGCLDGCVVFAIRGEGRGVVRAFTSEFGVDKPLIDAVRQWVENADRLFLST